MEIDEIKTAISKLAEDKRKQLLSDLKLEHYDKGSYLEEVLKKQITNGFKIRYLQQPDIVSGIELRVNGHKIAWSLNEYLEALVESLTETLQKEAHAA